MDVFEAVSKRRSVRKYKPKPIPEKDLKQILEAGRLAPSGGNRQPWYFVVVTEPETKKKLLVAANNQTFIADAGALIVAIGDRGTTATSTSYRLSSTRIAYMQDPMIAVDHMTLAAAALGYGTCWIGAYDEAKVKEILKIPENLVVVALLPVGVPDETPQPRPRKALREIFFKNVYGNPLGL